MTDHFERLLEYQDRQIKEEMSKKEEIELLMELRDDERFDCDVELERKHGGVFFLRVRTDEITNKMEEMLCFSILGQAELSFLKGKKHIEVPVNFDADAVAHELYDREDLSEKDEGQWQKEERQ